jgi:hypothetical protein
MKKSFKKDQGYDVESYDLSSRRPCRLTAILAKRDSGKTMWEIYLAMISEWKDVGMFVVISRTAKARALWSKFVHPAFIFPPDLELLEHLRNVQESNIQKYNRERKPFPPELHMSVYIDDCGSLKWFMRSNQMVELVSNSRQWEMDVTITFQHFTNWVPDGRENADEIMVLSTGDEKLIKQLRSNYVACMAKQDVEFIQIITQLTDNFGACVIKNRGGKTLEEICFWLRIPKEYLKDDVDESGQPTVVFKENVPIGNPHMRKWADERTIFKSKRTMEELQEDEYAEEKEDTEDIPAPRMSRFNHNAKVRCLPPKMKRD